MAGGGVRDPEARPKGLCDATEGVEGRGGNHLPKRNENRLLFRYNRNYGENVLKGVCC